MRSLVLDGNTEVIAMDATQSGLVVRSAAPAEADDHAGQDSERSTTASHPLISRRAALGGGLAGLAGLGGLLLFPGLSLARAAVPSDPFVILLKGLYHPVVQGPNLGLSMVDLNDGSYSTVPIYPISGVPGNTDTQKAIGDFYVQFTGDLCAYHIPGGSFVMQFTGPEQDVNTVPDVGGGGGFVLTGTWELTILEATGIYRPFVRGHNHMVDWLHFLAPGDGSGGVDESCICNVSRP
jgi:hypothetical protein